MGVSWLAIKKTLSDVLSNPADQDFPTTSPEWQGLQSIFCH